MTNELLPSTAMVPPLEQRGEKPGRGSVVIGIAAIAVIAVAAIAVTVSNRDNGGSGDPLFVLPVPADEWQLADGAVADPADDAHGTAERFITRGRLFGIADNDGYVDLRSETTYRESPLAGARWDEITTAFGDAYRRADDSITIAKQAGNDRWTVVSSPNDLVHVYGLLSNDITDDMVVIAAFSPPERRDASATSFEMISTDGSTFTVETSASDSPLFEMATYAERVEPVDINGSPGWLVTDELEAATATAVTWSPENGRTVNVRSTTSPDAVVDVARHLQTVSADEWTDVFPDTQVD